VGSSSPACPSGFTNAGGRFGMAMRPKAIPAKSLAPPEDDLFF